ncbi:SMI1/KNR4 family protein [Chitinophaga horti]|uniref:SMI1/KNR4 family protein n=1 Tax=Chitinophaga horti TaxID=2920382 RepID=UPI003D815792
MNAAEREAGCQLPEDFKDFYAAVNGWARCILTLQMTKASCFRWKPFRQSPQNWEMFIFPASRESLPSLNICIKAGGITYTSSMMMHLKSGSFLTARHSNRLPSRWQH